MAHIKLAVITTKSDLKSTNLQKSTQRNRNNNKIHNTRQKLVLGQILPNRSICPWHLFSVTLMTMHFWFAWEPSLCWCFDPLYALCLRRRPPAWKSIKQDFSQINGIRFLFVSKQMKMHYQRYKSTEQIIFWKSQTLVLLRVLLAININISNTWNGCGIHTCKHGDKTLSNWKNEGIPSSWIDGVPHKEHGKRIPKEDCM